MPQTCYRPAVIAKRSIRAAKAYLQSKRQHRTICLPPRNKSISTDDEATKAYLRSFVKEKPIYINRLWKKLITNVQSSSTIREFDYSESVSYIIVPCSFPRSTVSLVLRLTNVFRTKPFEMIITVRRPLPAGGFSLIVLEIRE